MQIKTYGETGPTEKQKLAHSCPAEELLYGGAKYGGKTVFLCWLAFDLARRFPGNRIWMGRKQSIDFKSTTLITFRREIPSTLYVENEQKQTVTFIPELGGSVIDYGGFTRQEDIQRFNSAEYGAILIDQAEEVSHEEYAMAYGSMRWKLADGTRPHYRAVLTANPANCWLKDYFSIREKKDVIFDEENNRAFIQALPGDNPHMLQSDIERLQRAFSWRPELIQAYLYGSWEQLEGADVVIPDEAIAKCVNAGLIPSKYDNRKVISCDVATFGDDETVIYAWEGRRIVDERIYGKKDTMITAGECVVMRKKHDATLIAVDSIGEGRGVVDRLNELKEPVMEIKGSEKATQGNYKNMRAQIWWEAGQIFKNREISIPDDEYLRGDLSSPRYKIVSSSGTIQIEGKDEIKRRLGRSPDRADALVMGLHALEYAKPRADKDWERYVGSRGGGRYPQDAWQKDMVLEKIGR